MLFIPFLEVILHTYIDNHCQPDSVTDAKEAKAEDEANKEAFMEEIAEMAKKLKQVTEVRLHTKQLFVWANSALQTISS